MIRKQQPITTTTTKQDALRNYGSYPQQHVVHHLEAEPLRLLDHAHGTVYLNYISQVGSSTPMQPLHSRATTLGKLFTPMCLCSPSSIIWYLARAFVLTRLYVAAITWGPMNKGSIVVAVLKRSDRLEPQYKLSTLLYFLPRNLRGHMTLATHHHHKQW